MAEPKVATTRVDQRPFVEILKESGFTKTVDGKTVGSFNAFERYLKKIDKNLTVFSNNPTMMNKVTVELNKVRKAKGMKEGGMVVKDKIVSIDTSPNSGLITVKGFGAGRRT